MPLIINKRQFVIGLVLLFSFGVTLAAILSPVFNGLTGLQVVDGIFNSLSKGSAYYIPELVQEAEKYAGSNLQASFQAGSAEELNKMKAIFAGAGAEISVNQGSLQINGDLGLLAKSALADADRLFQAGEEGASARYGFSDREAVYCWWSAFKQINKDFLKKNKAAEAIFTENVIKKVLEPAYNYAGIPPASFHEVMGISVGALVFYLVYTIWYGVAILFIFEGLGITASKPAEKAEA